MAAQKKAYLGWISKKELNSSKLNYDYAIPQDVFEDIAKKTGKNPSGHVVWIYPDGTIFGGPTPVSQEGAEILCQWIAISTKGKN